MTQAASNQAYDRLTERFRRISTIGECASMLNWDASAVMPPGGAAARTDQLAFLAGLEHQALTAPDGAVAVGSPEQVAEKILMEHELFANQRYVGQISVGAVAHADVMNAIELFGTEVAPMVRDEVARRSPPVSPEPVTVMSD